MFLLCFFLGATRSPVLVGQCSDIMSQVQLFSSYFEEFCKCCLETTTNHVFVLPFAFLDVYWCVVLNTNVY